MYDVDLFETPASAVAGAARPGRARGLLLQRRHARARAPGRVPSSVAGKRSRTGRTSAGSTSARLDVLGPILERRLDLCARKGFDGVEPDNVDGYANRSGFPLRAADQLRFNRFLARAAHARGLSIGLKNDLDQVAALEPALRLGAQRAVLPVRECERLRPFTRGRQGGLRGRVRARAGARSAPPRARPGSWRCGSRSSSGRRGSHAGERLLEPVGERRARAPAEPRGRGTRGSRHERWTSPARPGAKRVAQAERARELEHARLAARWRCCSSRRRRSSPAATNASTTSPTYTKSRVWPPSPKIVTGRRPSAAAAQKIAITPASPPRLARAVDVGQPQAHASRGRAARGRARGSSRPPPWRRRTGSPGRGGAVSGVGISAASP